MTLVHCNNNKIAHEFARTYSRSSAESAMGKRPAKKIKGVSLTGGRTTTNNGGGADRNTGRDRSKGVLVVTTNVGSLGNPPLSPSNIIVRQQLHDSLVEINNKHGGIDSLALQECMNYETELLPFFSFPAAHDGDVTYGRDQNGKRGVSIYTSEGAGAVAIPDTVNELCVVIRSYTNRRGVKVKFGLINCYRNQSVDFNRTSETTLAGILNAIKSLNNLNIYQYLVVGDFNDTVFSVPGLREIKHADFYHQANATTAKRKIDKIFSNIQNCGILEIRESCENVHELKENGDRVATDFGHKLACLYVGSKPKKVQPSIINIPRLKSIKVLARERKTVFPNIEEDRADDDHSYTEFLARTLTEKCKEILHDATVTIVSKKRNNQLILISALNEHADHGTHLKKKITNRWKATYNFMSRIKQGIGDGSDDSVRPELSVISNKLNNKLQNLNVMNRDVAIPAAEELFPVNLVNRGQRPTNKKLLKAALQSVSNSGALDYCGMSLRHTKTIFNASIDFRNFFQIIANRCFRGGYFPLVWRSDQISFLYKNKGDRMSPDSYRPITISPSLGKHLEKLIVMYLEPMNDQNPDNHAYTRGKSIQSAIVDCQKHLLKARNPLLKDKTLGARSYKYITCISTDDIKSAFESVEHDLMALIIERSFRGDYEIKMDQVIKTFLVRDAVAIERKSRVGGCVSQGTNSSLTTNTNSTSRPTQDGGSAASPSPTPDLTVKLVRRFKNKTAPQGSLLSPLLWRLYDAVFTSIYKRGMEMAVSDKIAGLFSVDHVSYADDHLSIFTLKVSKSESDRDVAKRIREAMLLCRCVLKDSTVLLGCGVNPAKSENIVPDRWHEVLKSVDPSFVSKSGFKWLGYHIYLTEDGQLKFDIKTIIAKFKVLCDLRDNIFQYSDSLTLRLKIYKTYFAPFVEFYAPIVIQGKESNLGTEVHKFQHDCLSKVTGACYTTSRKDLEEKTGEPSVLYKAIRLACRLQLGGSTVAAEQGAIHEANSLNEEIFGAPVQNVRVTRRRVETGTTEIRTGATIPTAINNYIFRINHFAKLTLPSNNKDSKLDVTRLKAWIKSNNSRIKSIIANRSRIITAGVVRNRDD